MKMNSVVKLCALTAAICAANVSYAAGAQTATVTIHATVAPTCSISATSLEFNNYDPTSTIDKTGTGTVTLTCVKGSQPTISLTAGLNPNGGQRRMINAVTSDFLNYDLFKPTATNPAIDLPNTACAGAGTVINYDLSFTSGIGRSTEFLSTELSTGIGTGVFVASQAYLHVGQNDRFIRLDTNYTLDQPEKLTTLRLGDAVSRPATTLGRSLRFAGIQYGSNFRVQPGLITAPLASLSGQAAVPSMVDLYINNVLQSSQTVPPGPFSITTPPMIAGDGEIVMKIRDISGREELISGRFYSTPYLLAPGLSEFSFEAGKLRNNYGLPEDSYSSLFSSASYRQGITEKFTAEFGAQGSTDGPKNILASGIRLVPSLGLFNLALGMSNSDSGTGSQFAAGFERRSGPMSVSFRTEHANEKFQQTGVDNNLVMRRLDNAFWNYRFDGWGNLGLSYMRK